MTTPPNILFLMDDQHRFDYLGCAGADWVRTPNIDRLAARGVRFNTCTTNSPICAPARISLATGLLPHRVAPHDNDSFLPVSRTTYYQRLRDHGYRVGCVGKLDLGKPDPYNGRYGDRPLGYSWGFTHPEEWEGKMHASHSDTPMGPYTHLLKERGLQQPFCDDYRQRMTPQPDHLPGAGQWIESGSGDSVLPVDAFEDTCIGQRAARRIEQVPDDFPWHYFVSFVGPHDPFDPPTDYADRYRHAPMPPAIPYNPDGCADWVQKRMLPRDPAIVATVRRQYCAIIELIDDQIGMILDALEQRGMMENTIIIFASDHGEMLGDHGMFQKSCAYESALRVPLIVSGPGVQAGVVSDALVELSDLNPTICALAGLPPQERIDARSFAALLQGETRDHRDATVACKHNHRTILTRTHKFIENYNDRHELYDLQADPGEQNNLIDAEPALAQSLRARLVQRMQEGQGLR